MLVIGIQNGFEGGVVKKILESGGNGVCWVKVDDSGRFCINYEGRQIGEHCLPFLWGWEEVGMQHEAERKTALVWQLVMPTFKAFFV